MRGRIIMNKKIQEIKNNDKKNLNVSSVFECLKSVNEVFQKNAREVNNRHLQSIENSSKFIANI